MHLGFNSTHLLLINILGSSLSPLSSYGQNIPSLDISNTLSLDISVKCYHLKRWSQALFQQFFFCRLLLFFFSHQHRCNFCQDNFCCVWIPLCALPSISGSAALQHHTPLWNAIPSRLPWHREMGNVFWASSTITTFSIEDQNGLFSSWHANA